MHEIQPANGKIVGQTFYYPVRVYYEDTDAGGIVYYANYLKFAERARTEFLRAISINQQQDLEQRQTGFVVRSCHIEYLASAVLDDALTVSCEVKELGAASATIYQEIRREDTLLAFTEVKVIHMDIASHRPTRITQEMRQKMQDFINNG